MTFEAGAVESSPASAGLALSQPRPSSPSRRRLQEDSSASSSTIFVASLGFNLHGRPSSAVEAGVTQIVVTSTSSGAVGFRARATTDSRTRPHKNLSLGREAGGKKGHELTVQRIDQRAIPEPIRPCFRFPWYIFMFSLSLSLSPLSQDIPLASPVSLTMRAVVSSTGDVPFCLFYNEDTTSWESSGLVIDSVTELSQTVSGAVDVLISCASFHLSDFSVTSTEVEPVFQPVSLVSNVLNDTTEASCE